MIVFTDDYGLYIQQKKGREKIRFEKKIYKKKKKRSTN